MSRCAALSAAADTPLSRAAFRLACTRGLVTLRGGVARRGQQALVQVGIEARHEVGGSTGFTQALDGVLGGLVVRRHETAAGEARFGAGHQARDRRRAALAVEILA